MRLILILSVALLLFSCGDSGDSPYTDTGGGGGGADGKSAEPEKPKQVASKEADLLKNEYKMLKRVRDGLEEKAAAKAAQFSAQNLPADAYYWLGLIYKLAGNIEESANAFQRFVDTGDANDPNHPWGIYEAAAQFSAIGAASKAEKYVQLFGQYYKDQQPKYYRSIVGVLARGYVQAGKLDKAIPFYEEVIELGDAATGIELIQTQWMLGKYDDAKKTADKLVIKAEGKPELNHFQAFAARAAHMGKPITSLDVHGWSQEDFKFEDTKGKVVLIYTWGLHILGGSKLVQRQMTELFRKYEDQGPVLVALSEEHDIDPRNMNERGIDLSPEDEVDGVKLWASHYKLPGAFGVVTGPDALKPLGYTPDIKKIFPMYALIGKDGRVRYFAQGKTAAELSLFETAFKRLLAE